MEFGVVAAGVLIEVDARVGGLIHRGGVEAGDGTVLLSVAGSRGLRGTGESNRGQKEAGGGWHTMAHWIPPKATTDNTRREGWEVALAGRTGGDLW